MPLKTGNEVKHSLAATVNDFLVASGVGAFVKKTLAETKTILELPASPYVIGDLLYVSSTSALSKLAAVAVGNVLISGGVGVAPSWGKVGLTTHVDGILGSANGGTGNGFAKFSGPATAEKTFTLPDASATILTTNAAVTAAQGGTGQSSYTVGDLLYASGATALSKLAGVAVNQVLVSGGVGAAPAWSGTPTLAGITCTAVNPLTTAAESWVGPSSTAGIYFKGGNVGIGTTAPTTKFVIGDSIGVSGANDAVLGNTGASVYWRIGQDVNNHLGIGWTYNATPANAGVDIYTANYGNPIRIDGPKVLLNTNSGGNVGIGTTAFGTSAVKVLGLGSGTAPSSFPIDMAQMCVKDQAAGNACFHFYTELGQIIKLYQQAALTTALTGITHTAPGTPDYALQNLVQNTGFGFVTADEGNSLLAVVANLQTRVGELATILANNGLTA